MAFLEESLGDPGIVTMHNGHHPEIVLTGDDSATGHWYLEDRVIVPAHDFELHGTALYDDRYAKVDGAWRIAHTGYDRIYEEHIRYSTGDGALDPVRRADHDVLIGADRADRGAPSGDEDDLPVTVRSSRDAMTSAASSRGRSAGSIGCRRPFWTISMSSSSMARWPAGSRMAHAPQSTPTMVRLLSST